MIPTVSAHIYTCCMDTIRGVFEVLDEALEQETSANKAFSAPESSIDTIYLHTKCNLAIYTSNRYIYVLYRNKCVNKCKKKHTAAQRVGDISLISSSRAALSTGLGLHFIFKCFFLFRNGERYVRNNCFVCSSTTWNSKENC